MRGYMRIGRQSFVSSAVRSRISQGPGIRLLMDCLGHYSWTLIARWMQWQKRLGWDWTRKGCKCNFVLFKSASLQSICLTCIINKSEQSQIIFHERIRHLETSSSIDKIVIQSYSI